MTTKNLALKNFSEAPIDLQKKSRFKCMCFFVAFSTAFDEFLGYFQPNRIFDDEIEAIQKMELLVPITACIDIKRLQGVWKRKATDL